MEIVAVAIVIAAVLGMTAGLRLTRSAVGPSVAFGLFIASLFAVYEIWLPRILRRRYEAEMLADPIRALRARRRERMGRLAGWGLGLFFGLSGLLGGLWAGGLM
jgi:cyanate permease